MHSRDRDSDTESRASAASLEANASGNQQPRRQSRAWNALYVLPTLTAATAASETARGLKDASPLVLYTGTIAEFACSFATDAAMTVNTVKSTAAKFTNRRHSAARNMITRRVAAAAFAAGTINAISAAYDSFDAYFYSSSIPGEFHIPTQNSTPLHVTFVALTALMTITAAISTILSEGIYTFTYIKGKLDGEKYKHTNHSRPMISTPASIASGLIQATSDMLSATIGTAVTIKKLNDNELDTRFAYTIAGLSLLKGFSTYAMTSSYIQEAVDDGISAVNRRPNKRPYATEYASIGLAILIAGYLGYATQELDAELLSDAGKLYHFEAPEALSTAFFVYTIVAAINEAFVNTVALTELFSSITNKLSANHAPDGYESVASTAESDSSDHRRIDSSLLLSDHSAYSTESTHSVAGHSDTASSTSSTIVDPCFFDSSPTVASSNPESDDDIPYQPIPAPPESVPASPAPPRTLTRSTSAPTLFYHPAAADSTAPDQRTTLSTSR